MATRMSSFVLSAGWPILTLGLLGLVAFAPSPRPQAANPSPKLDTKATADFQRAVTPLVKKYCLGCHEGEDATAGLDLGAADLAHLAAHRGQWDKVILNLRAQTMPPPGMPQPTLAEREALVQGIQRGIANGVGSAALPRVTLRRLNRTEYDRTIKDLLFIDKTFSEDFPSDDVGYGFDNIGDVLSVSPLHLEKYLDAADRAVREAIRVPGPSQVVVDISRGDPPQGIRYGSEGQLVYFTNATAEFGLVVPADGDYTLRIRAGADQAGPDRAKMQILINGRPLQTLDVTHRADQPEEYRLPLEAKAGRYVLAVRFTNDFYRQDAPQGQRDRNLHVFGIELTGSGTVNLSSLPESHRRLIPQHPTGPEDELTAARAVLTPFVTRAFRRPAQPQEVDRILQIFRQVRRNNEPYERAIQVSMQAVLVNPHFLFRVESPSATGAHGGRLTAFELASRLSYFLWGTMPDSELMTLAQSGQLLDAKVLEAQTRRMLLSPRAMALGEDFAIQWLQLRRLENVLPDPELFPSWNDDLRRDMATEAKMLFLDAIVQNRDVMELAAGRHTFINERLAKHYGLSGVTGAEFRRVDVSAANRGGLIGLGGVLTVTSNPNRTSPVKRGKWVMEEILGAPPPPPPPDVGVLADDRRASTAKTIKDRLAEHRDKPGCVNCHRPLDAYGFSLENFDAVGRWRTQDGPFPVDTTSELPDGAKITGVDGLRKLVQNRRGDFTRTLTEKLMIFGLGRGLSAVDHLEIDEIRQRLGKKGNRMQELMVEIVLSRAFTHRGGGR